MKQEDKKSELNKVMTRIKGHVQQVFQRYNYEVEKRNNDQIGGILHKNDKSEKIYSHLQDIAKQLKKIEKTLRQCEKLRKERRELFVIKTANFIGAINQITQDKNIKIKINQHIERLAAKSKECVTQTIQALELFKKESFSICGKSYDYKPTVEKTFLELSQLAFLWENISNFQSVTNQSVKEIFLPIQYKASDVKMLEEEISIILIECFSKYDKPQKVQTPIALPVVEKIQKSDLQLAHQYLYGFARPQEIARAVEIYQKQASKPNPDPSVFNVLGLLHQQGKGFTKDISKAFKYFMKSAEKGDPEGLYKVGQYLEKGLLNFKHYFDGLYANRDAQVRGGIEYYEKAAAKGHLNALTDLGYIYEKGVMHEGGADYFIEPHPDHAKKYYEKAKDKNFPRAYNNLGNLLIRENSQSNNLNHNAGLQKGIKYLIKARQLGCAKASLNLGKCYINGIGVAVNLQKGRAYFKQATELGEIQGRVQYLRSYIGTNLDEEETMSQLAETGRMLLIQNRNNPEALYMMGLLEEKGIGTTPNKQSSFHYIAAAARLDYPPALTRLGDYYYSGYYVQKNYENAKILYEKAAQRNDSQAFLNLALMQQKGLIYESSTFGSAEQLYKRAEELGNTNALLINGLKKEGSLLTNDKVIKAAQQGNYQALKMLTQNNFKLSMNSNQISDLKKISTFYMKEAIPNNRK